MAREQTQASTTWQTILQLFLSYFSIDQLDFSDSHFHNATYGRNCSSLFQVLAGSVEFHMRNKIIEGKAGDLFYCPEGTRYISYWTGSPNISFISTYHGFLLSSANVSHLSTKFVSFDRQFSFQKIEPLSNFAVASEMKEMFLEYTQGEQMQLKAIARLYSLMAQAYPYLKKQEEHYIYSAIIPALTYIEQNYVQNHPIGFYAEMCHLSESRFYYLFQKSMNYSPIEYRNSLRINHAAYLLRDTSYSIEQIAAITGFESPEYFRRTFKKCYSMTPTEYRKKVKR